MAEVKEETAEMMKRYLEMLEGVEDALLYIEENVNVEGYASPQVPQLFADVVEALQQVNQAHTVFQKEVDVSSHVERFDGFVKTMGLWNEKQSNLNKQELISQYALPEFKAFKDQMERQLNTYLIH